MTLVALGCGSGGSGVGGASGAPGNAGAGSGGVSSSGGAAGATSSSAGAGAGNSAGLSGGTTGSGGAQSGGVANALGGAGIGAGGSANPAGAGGDGGKTTSGGKNGTGGGAASGGSNPGGATAAGGTSSRGGGTGSGGVANGPCRPAPTTYRNLFAELLGVSTTEIDTKVEAAFQQLFHGSSSDQPIYYEFGTDEAYVLDVKHSDVRSEGVSYGMIIAVLLDKHQEFDRLWRFAVKRMRQSSGFFAWQLNSQGQVLSTGAAPDGEEYFATALIFASKRWGDGTGDLAYSSQAKTLLDKMANNGMFDRSTKLVEFGVNAGYTDPSYILPAFYEVWACFDTKNQAFWSSAASAGRSFFPKTVNMTTGLAPDQAEYNGAGRSGHADFDADAWRVVANLMMDHHYFNVDPWQLTFAAKLGAFFKSQGNYGEQYTLTGMVEDPDHQSGLVALNAMLGFGLPSADGKPFVQEAWELSIPAGPERYYNGVLYLLSMLHVSGKFQLLY